MKSFLNIWKKYIVENNIVEKDYKLFNDLDGCLVDFVNPVLKKMNDVLRDSHDTSNQELSLLVSQVKNIFGEKKEIKFEDIKEGASKLVHQLLFKVIEDDIDFWKNLPWKNDGKELWNYVINNFKDVYILSSPARGKGKDVSIEGKKLWIQKNLNIDLSKCFFESNKYIYASPNSILIDDYSKNIKEWENHDGIAILHKETKKTINSLNKILHSSN